MTTYQIPADAETACVTEAAAHLPHLADAAVHVGTRIPNPIMDEFVRITAVGGTSRDLVTDSPTLVVEGFARDETRAWRLCTYTVAALTAAGAAGDVGGVTCYGVDVAALPANLPFPGLPEHFRFSATVTADLRRTAR